MTELALVLVDGRPVRWDPARGDDVPRGGITTALMALSRELAARGHTVSVVADLPAPHDRDGVRFRPRAAFGELCTSAPVDALVAVPDLLALALPVPARARVAWSGNAFATGDCLVSAPHSWADDIGKAGRVARLLEVNRLDPVLSAFVAKSHWQAAAQADATGLALDRFQVIGNGVPLEHYRATPVEPQPARLVYTSQPRRGLGLLLDMLPEIRAHVPAVTVEVYGYDPPDPALTARAAAQGVAVHGALGKAALARELLRGGVMAYPNTLRETFCTAVAEAQAAGLAVVTSRRGALVERIDDGHDGLLIDGEPGSAAYRRDFVTAVVRLLTSAALRHELGSRARTRAHAEYSWVRLAAEWEQLLGRLSQGPATEPPASALRVNADCLLRDRHRTAVMAAHEAQAHVDRAVASYGPALSAPSLATTGRDRP
ncbi:MAG: hypothetical protein NVSMB55_03200 [Mycobacteriales bacterium]